MSALTVADVVNAYLGHVAASGCYCPSVLDRVQRILGRLAEDLGALPFADCGPAQLDGWLQSRTEWANKETRRRAAWRARAMFEWAAAAKLIPHNPLARDPARQAIAGTVGDVIGRYLEFATGARSIAPETLSSMKGYLRPFRDAFFELPVDKLSLALLETWVAENADRWRSWWTQRDAVRRVRMAFTWAFQRGLIAINPVRAQARPAAEHARPSEPSAIVAPPIPQAAPKTVADVLALYLAHVRPDLNPRSFESRRAVFQEFAAVCGQLLLAEARPFHLQLWLDAQRERWRSNWTRKRVNAGFQAAFNWARRLGITDRNPFHGVTVPAGERGEPMTPQEYQGALRASPACFRRLLVALHYTAARPGELCGARWDNLDEARACLTLRRHKTARRTRKPRRIMLHSAAMKLLRWIRRRDPHPEFIFVGKFGQPWTRSAIAWHIKELRRLSAIGTTTTLYGLRHGTITQAVLAGLDIATVAAIAGHEQITTTQIYLHVSGNTEHLQAAMERLFEKRPGSDRPR